MDIVFDWPYGYEVASLVPPIEPRREKDSEVPDSAILKEDIIKVVFINVIIIYLQNKKHFHTGVNSNGYFTQNQIYHNELYS